MSKTFIIIDGTEDKLVGTASDLMEAADMARMHAEETGNQTLTYCADLVSEMEELSVIRYRGR